MELIAEILLAVLAVFGLYALIRLFVTSRMSPAQMGIAVEIGKETDAEDVPLLLDRVRDSMLLCANGRIYALIDPALAENEAILSALRREGAEIYFVKR